MSTTLPIAVLEEIQQRAVQTDQLGEWPAVQLQRLAEHGVFKWPVPATSGGLFSSEVNLLEGYETISQACLTTALVLTQFHGAIQRLNRCSNEALKNERLPDLLTGRKTATLGISHLTTSLQHLGKPAVVAQLDDDSITLDGQIPWVTGAAHVDFILTGGTTSDGRQVLIMLPARLPGVVIEAHAKLVSLTASHTSRVALQNVKVPAQYLLAGPIESVMSQGSINKTGSLSTSVLALGHAARVNRLLKTESQKRPELADLAFRFTSEVITLRNDLFALAKAQDADAKSESDAVKTLAGTHKIITPSEIRQRANSLSLRLSQAYLGASKGAGFISGHPAEIAVREALFFLVWSCPQPVVQGILEELVCRGESLT